MPEDANDEAGEAAAKRLISLAQAAKLSGLSRSHLRMLVRQGTVWGVKMGRDWLTTEAAVRKYLATNPRPGPKPKTN